MRRLVPPFKGAANSAGFIDTAPGYAPYALDADGLPRLRNALPHTPAAKDRGQIGQRAGHSKVFDVQAGGPGGAPWQCLIPVSRSSVVQGFTQDECETLIDGTSIESGPITGNYWQRDSVPSSDGMGAVGTGSVNASAVCPVVFTNDDGNPYYLFFVSSNYDSGGFTVATIRAIRDDTGATVWQYTISTASTDRFINTMTCSDDFLFVCTNSVILMFRVLGDGTAYTTGDDAYSLVSEETLNGWAQETIEAGVWKNPSGVEYLFVLFLGSNIAGSTQPPASIVIAAGDPASHFRAGLQRFLIGQEYRSLTGPYAGLPLTPEAQGWGQALDTDTGLPNNNGDDFNEGFHGYFRFAEHSMVTGHGCVPTGLAIDPRSGTCYVIRTNQGYGPNTSYPPDGDTYPPISVCAVSFDGELLWEEDTGSILEVGMGGYPNDISTGAGDEPSLSAVRANALGIVCVAGRVNDAGYSVFGLDAEDGSITWAANVQDTGTVRQAAMAVDPGDQHFIMGGDRNQAWDGASGDDAHLWKVHPLSGAIVWFEDLGAAVSALTVSIMPDGSFVYGSDFV